MRRRRRGRGPALISIQSSEVTGSGAVYLEGQFPEFRLLCTVRGCRWRAVEVFHADAQALGFSHAAGHLWPTQQSLPLRPPAPKRWRDIFGLDGERGG